MKHDPIRFEDAIPEMPASFYLRMETTIEGMEDNMKRRYKLATVLVAALIIVALLAGVAFAAVQAVQSHLLWSLFPQGAPQEAQELLVADALTDEREGMKLTISEHLYDGRNLHLNWTVETDRDDGVFYLTTYRLRNADGTPIEISQWSSRSSSVDTGWNCLTPLNVTIGNWTSPKTHLGHTSNGFLVEEAPTQPWMYTLDVYAYTTDLTPVFVRKGFDEMPDEQIRALSDNGQIGIEYHQFSYIDRYPAFLAVYDNTDWSWAGSTQAKVDAHNTCGLLKPLTHLSVTLHLDPNDAANVKPMRLAEPQTLEFNDVTVWFEQLEFDLAGIHATYYVPADAAEYFAFDTQFLILDQDGNILNPAFQEMSGSWGPNHTMADGTSRTLITQGGGAVSKLPTELTFIRGTEEMRDLFWTGSFEEALAFIDGHPELRDEAKLTLVH